MCIRTLQESRRGCVGGGGVEKRKKERCKKENWCNIQKSSSSVEAVLLFLVNRTIHAREEEREREGENRGWSQ